MEEKEKTKKIHENEPINCFQFHVRPGIVAVEMDNINLEAIQQLFEKWN